MNRTDFELFITNNKLKKKDIARYLGVSSAFITALCSGARPVPMDKIDLIKSNPKWDTSMLGEDNIPKDQSVSTNSENTNQQSDDMTIQKLLEALERNDEQINSLLEQKARLTVLIGRLGGTSLYETQISPPLQNRNQIR